MELKIRNISEIFQDLPGGNKFRTDKPSIQTMHFFWMDLVYLCAKDTALEFSSLWCFCGSGSTTQSVCFSNLSWPYPWVKRYETSAGNPAGLTCAQPQFCYIMCRGHDWLYSFFYVFLLDWHGWHGRKCQGDLRHLSLEQLLALYSTQGTVTGK